MNDDPQCCQYWPNGHADDCPSARRPKYETCKVCRLIVIPGTVHVPLFQEPTMTNDSQTRCASGSWPGESQCEREAAGPDYVFCVECWADIFDLGTGCGCIGCAAYFKVID